MESEDTARFKSRQILFNELHPDPEQAATAAELLQGIDGVLEAQADSPLLLQVRYDVMHISLEQIETGLIETGFHLSNKLIYALKRALYHYTEETQRANSGCPRGDSNCTKKVFIERYTQRDHQLQDHRPEHWRKYL